MAVNTGKLFGLTACHSTCLSNTEEHALNTNVLNKTPAQLNKIFMFNTLSVNAIAVSQ